MLDVLNVYTHWTSVYSLIWRTWESPATSNKGVSYELEKFLSLTGPEPQTSRIGHGRTYHRPFHVLHTVSLVYSHFFGREFIASVRTKVLMHFLEWKWIWSFVYAVKLSPALSFWFSSLTLKSWGVTGLNKDLFTNHSDFHPFIDWRQNESQGFAPLDTDRMRNGSNTTAC
jgi:hypothetical protein